MDKRTTRTGYRGLQPVGVSVWLRCSSHTNTHTRAHTHTHTCTHNRGSVPAGGQSLPSSYTFILSFPSFPSFPLSIVTPFHTSFLSLSPSSLIPSLVTIPPLLLLRRGKKGSVKDTEELANSNEKLGGRGQNHHRGQLWLGLCTYTRACVCVCA